MSEPVTPPPDEPRTPMWLPALGAALFLLVGIWWATRPSAAPPREGGEKAPVVVDAGAG
jgi:hypothetical protein